jgi:anion-transporting  ArsA/GET3 family ATPase
MNHKIFFNQQFNKYLIELKSLKKDYQTYLKFVSLNSQYEQQMVKLEDKETKKRVHLFKTLTRLKNQIEKTKFVDEKMVKRFEELNKRYQTYNLDQQKQLVNQKIQKNNSSNQQLIEKFKNQKEKLYNELVDETNKYKTQANSLILDQISNLYYNGINSVEIAFEILDKRVVSFKKRRELI